MKFKLGNFLQVYLETSFGYYGFQNVTNLFIQTRTKKNLLKSYRFVIASDSYWWNQKKSLFFGINNKRYIFIQYKQFHAGFHMNDKYLSLRLPFYKTKERK